MEDHVILWKTVENYERPWKTLKVFNDSERFWKTMKNSSERFWNTMKYSQRLLIFSKHLNAIAPQRIILKIYERDSKGLRKTLQNCKLPFQMTRDCQKAEVREMKISISKGPCKNVDNPSGQPLRRGIKGLPGGCLHTVGRRREDE